MRRKATHALVAALALAAAGTGGVVATAGGPDRPGGGAGTDVADGPGGTDRRLVLVSGRDDHGLLATARVPLKEGPGGGRPVAQVKDGTLARVVSTQGTWLEVRTVEGRRVQGWVDDFYLRGRVHLVGTPPSCRVRVGGHRLAAGEQAIVLDVRGRQARVRVARTGRTGWVPRSAVQELAPVRGCARPGAPTSPDGHDHEH